MQNLKRMSYYMRCSATRKRLLGRREDPFYDVPLQKVTVKLDLPE